jgi:NAD(P)-dependent dehydrogenase (short-subunit alcohol dehydrogenase family)/SAM-dependent methyltransferase/acyl carrier protein
MNALVQKAVSAVLRDWPMGRGLRVLEIGAGTGGTTAYVLPALRAEETEYTFTDISARFITEAEEKFKAYGNMRGGVLDIERSPAAQGFAQYELIVAANVIHATRDLRETLGHVRELLAPGGVFVLLEGTGRIRFIDLIFGLTEGWWRFKDLDLRPSHPLLAADKWAALLKEIGFAEAAALAKRFEEGGLLSRQAVIVAQAPERGNKSAGRVQGRWLILADQQGVGEQLAELLKTEGEACSVALAADIDPTNPADFERLLESAGGDLRGVVHMWSFDTNLDAKDSEHLTSAQLMAASERNCGSALHLVQALAKRTFSQFPRLCLVTRGTDFAQSPILGLGKIISLEHPELRTIQVDLDAHASAETLFSELMTADREDQVSFRENKRYVARLVRHDPLRTSALEPLPIRAQGTYLITGGLGGLGLLLADWLIAQGARHIVLAGRSGPTPEANAKLSAMADAGARVTVMRADVSVYEDVARALSEIDRNLPPLRGIFHAAGVLDDGMLMQQDWARFSYVMEPKVSGAWNLHTLTRNRPPDFLILFSSSTSLLGSPGQGNHAAANAFLDSFAYYLEAQGVRSMSINWGAWADIGAAAARNVGDRIKAKGMDTIPPDQGLAALAYLFAKPTTQIGVMPISWPLFMDGKESFPFLSDFRRAAGDRNIRQQQSNFLEELQAVPATKRRALLATHVESQVAKVLGLKPSLRLDPQQGFFELGMDSLTSMEFKNRLQNSLGLSLPNTLAFDYPNLDAVVDYLVREPRSGLSNETLERSPEATENSGMESLDEMSKEHLDDMIDAMIGDLEKRKI